MTPAPFRVICLTVLTALSACAGDPTGSRIAEIEHSSTRIQFNALGDTVTFHATAVDGRGTVIQRAQLQFSVSDPGVASVQSEVEDGGSDGVGQVAELRPQGVQLVSVAPGRTLLTVQDLGGVVAEQVVIDVDQTAATLAIIVGSTNGIVILPVGATFPLECRAFDKNGFAIVEAAILLSSVKGTVRGTGCGDASVERSGYDTLVFSLGAAQVRVPVVVATRPEAVEIVAAAQPLTTVERERFVGEDLANPLILALRPLVNEILTPYGNPTSNLDRARALRDWLARTAIHPAEHLHPDGSTSNLTVLPPGKTWADANVAGMGKLNEDRDYWGGVGMDGYAMLNSLLGTLDPATGYRANDGMMVRFAGARYKIRDVESYKYVQCSYQDVMLYALWAAAGLHGMAIATVDHDPAAVFIPELGRWVYQDPTYNEEYLLDGTGEPLSPSDLLLQSSAGSADRLRATKRVGPSFDPAPYITMSSYLHAGNGTGVVIMGSQLNSRVVGVSGPGGWPVRNVQIDVPRLAQEPPFNDPVAFVPVTPAVAFPQLGVVVQGLETADSVYIVRLSSTFPNSERFERRVGGGAWESAQNVDILPVGQCRVEYRSLDAVGSISAIAVVDVWVPRAEGFIQSAVVGSVRARARYCM